MMILGQSFHLCSKPFSEVISLFHKLFDPIQASGFEMFILCPTYSAFFLFNFSYLLFNKNNKYGLFCDYDD